MIGELSALAPAFCWSGSSIAFAEATLRLGSVRVNVTRLLLAGLLLALTITLFAIPLHLSYTQLADLGVSGVLGLVMGDTFLFKSYEDNGARISSLVMSVAPAIAAALAFALLGESLSPWAILGVCVALGGIVIVVAGGRRPASGPSRIKSAGLLYAFLGACGQAGGLIAAKMAFNEGPVNGLAATFVRIVCAVVLLLPASLFSRRFRQPFKMFLADKKAFGLTLLGAILGPYLGITFSLISIEYAKVAIAATIMATVPIIMLPLVKLIYKEDLTWRAYVGAFVTVGGVAILFLR